MLVDYVLIMYSLQQHDRMEGYSAEGHVRPPRIGTGRQVDCERAVR